MLSSSAQASLTGRLVTVNMVVAKKAGEVFSTIR